MTGPEQVPATVRHMTAGPRRSARLLLAHALLFLVGSAIAELITGSGWYVLLVLTSAAIAVAALRDLDRLDRVDRWNASLLHGRTDQ